MATFYLGLATFFLGLATFFLGMATFFLGFYIFQFGNILVRHEFDVTIKKILDSIILLNNSRLTCFPSPM